MISVPQSDTLSRTPFKGHRGTATIQSPPGKMVVAGAAPRARCPEGSVHGMSGSDCEHRHRRLAAAVRFGSLCGLVATKPVPLASHKACELPDIFNRFLSYSQTGAGLLLATKSSVTN